MEFLFLIAGIALGFAVAWFYFKSRKTDDSALKELEQKVNELEVERGKLLTKIEYLELEKSQVETELKTTEEDLSKKNDRLARAEQAFQDQEKRLKEQKQELEELQKKFTTEFENIANKLLEEKSKKFTEQNKTNISDILNPLKEKITEFEKKVESTNKEGIARNSALKAEIGMLKDLNEQMSKDATNLTKALKGDTKKQGNWGEILLEKILERSGLIKDREYKTQVNTTTHEGRRQQPDIVVYLPDEKHVVIDSKVSLVAYEQAVNAENEEDRQKHMKHHVISLRKHVKDLSEKNYQASADFDTPDFVLLFVPIEASFAMAVQYDSDLFNYAWDQKIVIVSPSTLLATLRTIASIWKQERQNRNALEIADESGKLYDKFVGFLEDLEKIKRGLDSSTEAYDKALNKLQTGRGNLIGRAEKIRALGANTKKEIPDGFRTDDEVTNLLTDEKE